MLVLVIALAVFLSACAPTCRADPEGVRGPLPSGPVVLELFTSQGCSSCPPADRLLTRLGADAGADVLPLAFHVDYWNHLGWSDPFSSAAWSERQQRYGRALPSGRLYTPQLVIDGRRHCVGSDDDEIERHLAWARRQQRSGRVELVVGTAADTAELVVTVKAASGGVAGAETLDLLVAVFETGLVTPVGRGENAHRTLHNDFVVRSLAKVASIPAGETEPSEHRMRLPVAADWQPEHLGVAAFLQEPRRLGIHGAAVWRDAVEASEQR